jgi:hypothetical protein
VWWKIYRLVYTGLMRTRKAVVYQVVWRTRRTGDNRKFHGFRHSGGGVDLKGNFSTSKASKVRSRWGGVVETTLSTWEDVGHHSTNFRGTIESFFFGKSTSKAQDRHVFRCAQSRNPVGCAYTPTTRPLSGDFAVFLVLAHKRWLGFNSHLWTISVVQSDRSKHAYLNPLPEDQDRCGKVAPGMIQGHRYLGVLDPRRTETFASKRRHPDSQNPHL